MRLRLAPVEYKVCTTEHCNVKYEGSHCPVCRHPFDPEKMMKGLQDRLILVDVDPPVYEQTQRCRCPECKNLFNLSEHDVIEHAQCSACGKPLFGKQEIQKLWKDADTLLQRARKLDRARKQVPTCPHCAAPVLAVCWCPLHGSTPHSDISSGLSQNPTGVWVRTFYIAESIEELQRREGLEEQGEGEEEEAEPAIATKELDHDAEEQHD